MLSDYAAVGVLLAIVLTIPLGGYAVTWLLRPKRSYALKNQTYECGLETIATTTCLASTIIPGRRQLFLPVGDNYHYGAPTVIHASCLRFPLH